MPCSVCFAHGHNIRTCQFKNEFITRDNPSNIKQKKQKSVFKDKNQMSQALRDLQELYCDRTKLLENKDKQKIEIQKHMDHFPQDKQLLKRVKDNTIANYNGIPGFKTIYNISSTDDNIFISNPDSHQMRGINRFLRKTVLINKKPQPAAPICPSEENMNENNIKIYNHAMFCYNYEIEHYSKEIVPTKLLCPKMTNNKLRLNRLLSMITQLSRIERAYELTDVINHNSQSIIQPFQKAEDIHTYTKHNRIVRLTKHYSDSLEHNTNLPDDMVRNVLSFLI
tara:strand:- start:292 stop:1134 length:843 start_codon:yes stop_codon:yes gene_type:complete